MTRNPLLPVLAGSRAVLVGRDVPEPDVDYGSGRGWESAELATTRLSQVLVSPAHQAFEMTGVTELVGNPSPVEVMEAMRQAAAEASDTLLFSFSATGPISNQSQLATVARIMQKSAATRLVVLLDCSDFPFSVSHFLRLVDAAPNRVSLLAGERSMLFDTEIDPLTSNLAEAIAIGVEGGPEALDLVSLRDAIWAKYIALRETVDNEWILGEKSLICRGGERVALGINPALPPDGAEPRREVSRSVVPLGKRNIRENPDVRNAVSLLIRAILAAAPALWTSKVGAAPGTVSVQELTAENEVPKRYVLFRAGSGWLRAIHHGDNSPRSTHTRIHVDDVYQLALFLRQLHVDGVFPARGFSATAAVNVPFPPGNGGIEIYLRALIAMQVPGWTAITTSDPAEVRWRAQDPEDQGRSVSIEKQPGDEGGAVTVIGTTALGVEQRILLPPEVSRDIMHSERAADNVLKALTTMGILPVEAQWGSA